MDELEKVERLRQKADVSYEEAKEALEKCGWDLLDAMVELEKQGKVKKPGQSSYTTHYEEPETIREAAQAKKSGCTFTGMLNRFFDWCSRVIKKGNSMLFHVEREGKKIISMPVTVFVILMLFGFWFFLVLMVVGLFLGCRYSFEGLKRVDLDVNKAMDSAAQTAEKIKEEFTNKKEE